MRCIKSRTKCIRIRLTVPLIPAMIYSKEVYEVVDPIERTDTTVLPLGHGTDSGDVLWLFFTDVCKSHEGCFPGSVRQIAGQSGL